MPDRLTAQLRHLPAAGGPLEPHPHRDALRAAVPDHPRRAGGMRRAAARRAPGPAGRHRRPGTAAGHPGAADGGRVGRRVVAGRRAARPGQAGGAVPGPVRRGLRGHRRPAGRGDPHRPRAPRLLPAPRPGERDRQGPPRRPAGRADLGRGHPRARRLPGRRRARRGPDRHRPRGMGRREQAGRRLPARHPLLAHPPGGAGHGPGGGRERRAALGAALAGGGTRAHPGAFRGGLGAAAGRRGPGAGRGPALARGTNAGSAGPRPTPSSATCGPGWPRSGRCRP